MDLSGAIKITEHIPTTVTGTSTITGTAVDMAGFEGVLFICKLTTAASNNTIKAQQDTAVGMGSAADLAGSSVAVGASDEIVWLELNRPQERFVRAAVLRGTTTVIEWCVAIQYSARLKPVSNALAGTIAGKRLASPVEGTA